MRVMHKSLEYSKDLAYSVGLPTEPPVGSDMTSWNLEGGIWQEASISMELLPFSLLLSLPPLTVFLPAGGCFGNLRTFFFFFTQKMVLPLIARNRSCAQFFIAVPLRFLLEMFQDQNVVRLRCNLALGGM